MFNSKDQDAFCGWWSSMDIDGRERVRVAQCRLFTPTILFVATICTRGSIEPNDHAVPLVIRDIMLHKLPVLRQSKSSTLEISLLMTLRWLGTRNARINELFWKMTRELRPIDKRHFFSLAQLWVSYTVHFIVVYTNTRLIS